MIKIEGKEIYPEKIEKIDYVFATPQNASFSKAKAKTRIFYKDGTHTDVDMPIPALKKKLGLYKEDIDYAKSHGYITETTSGISFKGPNHGEVMQPADFTLKDVLSLIPYGTFIELVRTAVYKNQGEGYRNDKETKERLIKWYGDWKVIMIKPKTEIEPNGYTCSYFYIYILE